jgi:RNAse H-fold protein YqgF
MKKARLLGLDVGEKRIGIAISDPFGWSAQPVKTLHRQSDTTDFEEIAACVAENQVACLVVGLPKNMNGTIGSQGESVQAFAEELKTYLSDEVEVRFWDERLSSRSAERVLLEGNVSRKKRKDVIDKMAAVIILQNYLDAHPN